MITLEVSQDQAQKLTWIVEQYGSPYISLRNNDDRDIVKVGDTTLLDVMGNNAGRVKADLERKNASRGK